MVLPCSCDMSSSLINNQYIAGGARTINLPVSANKNHPETNGWSDTLPRNIYKTLTYINNFTFETIR